MKKTAEASLPLEVLGIFRIVFKSASKHFESIERAVGVSGAQLWALAEVKNTDGLTISQISARMALHQSTTSNLLDKLESKGLIERRRSNQDRRVVTVHATELGEQALAKAPGPFIGILPDALMRMTPEELENLKSSMSVLLNLLELKSESANKEPLGVPIRLQD